MAAKLLQISENSALSPVFLHKNVIDSRKTEYQEHNYALYKHQALLNNDLFAILDVKALARLGDALALEGVIGI